MRKTIVCIRNEKVREIERERKREIAIKNM